MRVESATRIVALLVSAALVRPALVPAESVAVRHTEGAIHGFLVLGTLEGETLADGDVIQVASGDLVTCRVVFRFKDGSISEETAVFSQRDRFRLLSDHIVQRGPAFPHPMDVAIDGRNGQITVHYTDEDGGKKVLADRLDLPADLANGMILTLLKNIRPDVPSTTVSMLAATPKLRTVKLSIKPSGDEPLSIGSSSVKATHFVVKVEIGGLKGVLAGLLGKQPPDSHVWILGGEAPAFVKSEAPLYLGGPIWRIELVSPIWPKAATARLSSPQARVSTASTKSREPDPGSR